MYYQFFIHLCRRIIAEQVNSVYTFGFLGVRKQYSKTAYQIGNQDLKLAFGKLFSVTTNTENGLIIMGWYLPLKV